jgi:hypothetical protein
VSQLEREVQEALERARADELPAPRRRPNDDRDAPRTHYRRGYEPLRDGSWGALSFLQPPTPWHLVGIGLLLFFLGRMLGRAALGAPLETIGLLLLAIGGLSLILLPRAQPKRWRGRLITTDDSWQARLYRKLYKR